MRAGEGRGDVQVLSRALCRFRWVPFGSVPVADRRSYVQVQLRGWAPFEDSDYALVGATEGVMAFAWDRQAFEQRANAAGLPPKPALVWPETLLLPPHDDAVVLQRCSEGVEGQVWRARQLVASRWWAEPPDAAAWINFQRSAGIAAAQQRPEVPAVASVEPAWLDEPWGRVQTLAALAEQGRLRLHALAAVVLAALLLPTLWLAHANWEASREVAELEAQKTEAQARAQPVLAARGEAMSALATIDAAGELVRRPDALALLAHLSDRLPRDGSRIRNLEWEGRRLRLVLTGVPASTARIAYVQALEGGGWLQGVREDTAQDTTPGTVALAAEVSGLAPPAPAASAAAASAPSPAPVSANAASAPSAASAAAGAARGPAR